ncbi:beta-1,3-galactosyltransferase 5-like [Asterias amurensis]|uniref:beta-1,3-galactosyltransferase 5-like n=1 Tax=Asterias amurensis TaxID=7602 RepID=UPI003AB44EA3
MPPNCAHTSSSTYFPTVCVVECFIVKEIETMKTKTAFYSLTLIVGLLLFGTGYFLHRRVADNLLLAQRDVYETRLGVSGSTTNITITGPTIEMTTVEPVVNPHLFNFTIRNQAACFNRSNSNGELFLVLLVKCAPFEKLDREQIRKTWGGVKEVLGRRVLTMFLLGESTDPIIRKQVQEEDSTYHDLIQEDFIDNYKNLTYKNMMGLKWVSMYCPQNSFVVSVDADMVINIVTLVKRLSTMPKTNFAEGHLRTDTPIIRKKKHKCFVPKEEWADNLYPPFLMGACYAMSRDAAVGVFDVSKYIPFLRLDDVFVGICLTKAGVQMRYSPLYQQYVSVENALKRGIGIGIAHNRDHLKQPALKLWHKMVGSQIQDMSK